MDPTASTMSFGLHVWDRSTRTWQRITSQAFLTDAAGEAVVTIRRRSSSFTDPDARLVLGARYRIRAFVLDGGSLTASNWSFFRVT